MLKFCKICFNLTLIFFLPLVISILFQLLFKPQNSNIEIESKWKNLFVSFDSDKNGVLSLEEFQLFADQSSLAQGEDEVKEDEVLFLYTEMTSLNLTSLSQVDKNHLFGSKNFLYPSYFNGLLSWKSAAKKKGQFSSRDFQFLLPSKDTKLGRVYWILKFQEDTTSSKRYLFVLKVVK